MLRFASSSPQQQVSAFLLSVLLLCCSNENICGGKMHPFLLLARCKFLAFLFWIKKRRGMRASYSHDIAWSAIVSKSLLNNYCCGSVSAQKALIHIIVIMRDTPPSNRSGPLAPYVASLHQYMVCIEKRCGEKVIVHSQQEH